MDCTGDTCTLGKAILTVEFPGISSVHTYVKVDDGQAGKATGGSVDQRTYKTNEVSLAVLKNTYDVLVKKGSAVVGSRLTPNLKISRQVLTREKSYGILEALPIWKPFQIHSLLPLENSNVAVTIYDVAKRAGVGIGTVSRVLNDSPQVSEVTRQKVLTAIEELNYHPSPIAKCLSLRRTFTVGVITPFFTRPAFIGRLRGVEAALTESEYDLVLYNVETTDKRDACFRKLPISQRFDGLLLIALPPTDEDVAHFRQAGIPVVLVDAYHPALSHVVIDDVKGGYMATKHLIELGHTRLAYISDPLESPFRFTSSLHRYQGYRQALDEAGIPFRQEYHRWAEHGEEQARDMARHLLDLDEPPTAIFAASDTQAIGAMEAIRERGLRIPQDVALVGYDDIEVSRYLGLTTIRQPFFETGVKGVEVLLQAIDHPSTEPCHIELPIELICRRSTVGDTIPPENH